MPCYMVIDGKKQEMDEDVFDQLVEALHQSNDPHNPPAHATTRWKPDGSYDKKPLDPDYFFQNTIRRNYQSPSNAQTADR